MRCVLNGGRGDTEDSMTKVIRVAAVLDLRYSNPQVCAFNRERAAKSDKWRAFWHDVANALHRPYHCQGWLQDEMRAWDAIRAHQRGLKVRA
jgi:hypothetical protein